MEEENFFECDRYKDCFDHIFAAIIVCDSKGYIIAANPSASCIFEKDFSQFEGKVSIYDLTAEHEKHVLEQLMESSFNECGIFSEYNPHEVQFISDSGKTILANTFVAQNQNRDYIFTITDISDLKKNEVIAQEREKQLLDLTNNLHGAVYQFIYVPNKKPEFLYVSDGIADVYEITKEELELDPNAIQKLFYADNKNSFATAVLEAFLEKKPCEIEHQIKTRSGKKKWVYAVANPHRMSDGKLIWTGYSMDITEQKNAQEKIRESEQRLRIHTQFSPLAYIEWDTELCVKEWNTTAETIFGFNRDEAIGRHAFDLFVPPELYDETKEIWNRLLRQSGGYRTAAKCINNLGEYVYCEWYNTPLFDEKGNIIGVTSMVLDISKRKQAEIALKQSEQRFRNVAEIASDWIWETDAEGKFTYVSDRYSKVIGIPAEKVIGKHLRDMYVSEDPKKKREWLQAVDDILNHKGFWDYEFQVEMSGQRPRWFRISGAPFFDNTGNYRGHRGTGTDTTEQRVAENALIASEEKFRHIAETSFDWFWETDSNDCFKYVSEGFLKSLNMTKENVIGRHIKDMLVVSNNDQIKAWHKFLDDIDARRSFKDYQYQTPSQNGNPRWFKVSGAPYFGHYGEYMGFRGAGVDMTTEKMILIENNKCHRRMQEIISMIGVVVWETDNSLKLNLLSDNCKDIFETNKENLLSRNIKELFVNESGSVVQEIDARRLFVDQVVVLSGVHFDGDEGCRFEISGKPYYDHTHEFLGYRGTCKRIDNSK